MSPAAGWLMKETLASEMRRQEGNTLRVNTIIDFIQMESVPLRSESDAACFQSMISIISLFPNWSRSLGVFGAVSHMHSVK